jgi:hypothetical protein
VRRLLLPVLLDSERGEILLLSGTDALSNANANAILILKLTIYMTNLNIFSFESFQ